MITGIETCFEKGCGRCAPFDTPDCSARRWAMGLATLRGLCRDAGLGETVKWGQPYYRHAGRNTAILGAFRADFRVSFFEAALLSDPDGVLDRQGPNTKVAEAIRFRDDRAPAAMAQVVGGLLRQAMANAEAGRRAPRVLEEADLPAELTAALDADPVMAEAFGRLTPCRRRRYAIALASARTSATRAARVARFRERILAGKGATER